MGYRFSLETANTVANLAFGKVLSTYRDIFSTESRYYEFKEFLDTFEENLFVGDNPNDEYWNDYFEFKYKYHRYRKDFYYDRKEFYHKIVRNLSECLSEQINRSFDSDYNNEIKENDFYLEDRMLLEHLSVLSDIISQCRIKSLLLPRPYTCDERNEINDDFMTEINTLKRLLHWHPYDSCLILQPKKKPDSKNITIFDAFPNFDFALRQLDLWPAVMFWNNRNGFIFAPVNRINELEEMYAIMHYEKRDSFGELQRYVSSKIKTPMPHYYLHLSDLHFGAKKTPVNVRRLRTLVDKQIDSFTKENIESTVNFVITGDVVDSPKPKNTTDYLNFRDFINERSSNSFSPLAVFGNHDINSHGLSINNNNQQLITAVGFYPKIEIDDDIRVIFLLFNSNSNGFLAEGEIGTDQLSEMGNQIDKILKNDKFSDYKLVAVLHHHVVKIPNPEWRTKRWYKKLIPEGFLEKVLRLRDADIFKEWLQRRGIKLVLHGHKHVPYIGVDGEINIVACGSSTGKIENTDKQKTYISYNIIKFNKNTVICTLCAEEILGSGAININTSTLNYKIRNNT